MKKVLLVAHAVPTSALKGLDLFTLLLYDDKLHPTYRDPITVFAVSEIFKDGFSNATPTLPLSLQVF